MLLMLKSSNSDKCDFRRQCWFGWKGFLAVSRFSAVSRVKPFEVRVKPEYAGYVVGRNGARAYCICLNRCDGVSMTPSFLFVSWGRTIKRLEWEMNVKNLGSLHPDTDPTFRAWQWCTISLPRMNFAEAQADQAKLGWAIEKPPH